MKYPQLLKYLVARREGGEGPLRSEFSAVIEPHKAGAKLIAGVERATIADGGSALLITHADGTRDLVGHDAAGRNREVTLGGIAVATDACFALVRLAADGAVERVFFAGGTSLSAGGRTWNAAGELNAEVLSVDAAKSELRVRAAPAMAERLAGRVVGFANPVARTANTITTARADAGAVVLTARDDLLAGVLRVTAVEGARLRTSTQLPMAPSYVGGTALNAAMQPIGRIRAAGLDFIELEAAPADAQELIGRDAWIAGVGPGDRVVLPAQFSWER